MVRRVESLVEEVRATLGIGHELARVERLKQAREHLKGMVPPSSAK